MTYITNNATVGEDTSAPSGTRRNIGYLGLADHIQKKTGVEKNMAAMLACFLTKPNSWDIEAGWGDPDKSMVYFHSETDESNIPSQHNPANYPQAVSFNGLTYDKCLQTDGMGPSRAAAFITVLELLGSDQST